MNITCAALVGLVVGALIGYILRDIQDTAHFEELRAIYEDYVRSIKKDAAHKERIYRQEISRLHMINAKYNVPEKANITDYIELSLLKDGYKEIDFPNGGIRNGKNQEE